MRKHVKNTALLAALAGLAIGAMSTPSQAQGDPVRIGVIMPLTGNAAYYGQLVMDGVNLAVEEINNGGGVLGGRKVETVVEDGKCLPSETAAAGKKLIFEDNIKVLIGALCSSATLALQQTTGENKVVHITPISVSPKLTDPSVRHKYYFRTLYSSTMMARGFADFVAQEIKPKNFAFLAVNDDYGRGDVSEIEARFDELGTPEVVYSGNFEFGDTDFTSVLARIRSENPEGVYMVARNPQNVLLLKQMRSIGFRPNFLAGDTGFSTPKTIADAGAAIEGLYMPIVYLPGETNPGAVAFESAYQAKFNRVPTTFVEPSGWVGIQLAAYGIDKAGSETDTDKIAAAIQAAEMASPLGLVRFDENGQNQIKILVGQVKNGSVVKVR